MASSSPQASQSAPAATPLTTPSSSQDSQLQSANISSAPHASQLTPSPTAGTLFQTTKRSLILTPESMGNEIVKLYVGNKRKEFTVHKKLLCDRVEFFSKAFNGGFQEAATGEMYLPEDNPDVVSHLIDYIYRGALPETGLSGLPTHELYLFAEKICMLQLMDELMDDMINCQQKENRCFGAALIDWIFSNSGEGSKLRLLCVAEAACRMKSRPGDKRRMEEYATVSGKHPEFLLQLFRFQTNYHTLLDVPKLKSPKRFEKLDQCMFHCHGEDTPCHLKETVAGVKDTHV